MQAAVPQMEAQMRAHIALLSDQLADGRRFLTGDRADFARAQGKDPSVTNYVVGIRFWF
jgi:hypothetical protein